MNVSIDIDMDDLWSNLEDFVADRISNDLSDADYICRGDVLAECEDEFYDILADHDFSQQFDYYMEGYDFSELTGGVSQEQVDALVARIAELESRTLKARTKRAIDWLGGLTRKVHWHMPRR